MSGFSSKAVYLDDADAPIGGRFVHERTGFVLDVLQIESAPQAFVWANTFPTSDMGEPHTQEHLLLGKGTVGRAVASQEAMSLTESSAFTMQWRTCYHFHTVAGTDVFWDIFESKMHGLLHPDYTDEEIRREVRNFGVSVDPKTRDLRLEEKGTVYNEMVRTFESSGSSMWRQLGFLLYGERHPLALSSGGFPDAIREMTPEDIRTFHRSTYHLANMGAIAAFPKSLELADILAETDRMLTALQGEDADMDVDGRTRLTEADLPPPAGAPAGTVRIATYPLENAHKPGSVVFAWPPTRELSVRDELLLELFLSALAGDETTNLYKLFVDSKTRKHDVGATGAWSWISGDQGYPVYMGLSNVKVDHLDEASIIELRAAVLAEIRRIADLPDGDPELEELNEQIAGRILQTRRGLSKFMNSPPRFGIRGTSSSWMRHLHQLARDGEFRTSLTMRPHLAFVEQELAKDGNIWRDYLAAWGLLDTVPYAVATRASPELLETLEKGRDERIAAELARIEAHYGSDDSQAALAKFKDEYDAATAEIERLNAGAKLPAFIDSPPMTLDDELAYRVYKVTGHVDMVESTFESMTGGTVGIALRLDGIREDDLMYLSAMPSLMTEVGIYDDGEAIAYDDMKERLRNEIMSVGVSFSTNYHTGRAELIGSGSGNDLDETRRSIEWLARVLRAPDWRPENLERILDVVDRMASGARNRMLGSEEGWVHNPAAIYLRQDNPLLAHTASFLTRAHNIHRLRWMLRTAGEGPESDKTLAAIAALAPAAETRSREQLTAMAKDAKAPAGVDAELYGAALSDLGQIISGVPDGSLAADWRYLVDTIVADLKTEPATVLARLDRIRKQILEVTGARMFAIASTATHKGVTSEIDALLGQLSINKVARQDYSTTRFVDERLRGRVPDATSPLFVGLVNPNTQQGVFVNSAEGFHYSDTDEATLLDYLTSNLYTGHGAHSIFMKTWLAGLAYSNGLRGSLSNGRISYYAERCPELPQTLGFVIAELERAELDESLAEYAIAESFSARVASSYERRGMAIANDLADGITPDMVRTFRASLLSLRTQPNLARTLFDRMDEVYGRVLPGYGTPSTDVAGGVFYVIGPDKQLDLYQEYLHSAEGPDATLYKLYPRDYWVVGD